VIFGIAAPVRCQDRQTSENGAAQATGAISGSVTLEGHPQGGISIYLRCSTSKSARDATISKKTDAAGRYSFDGLTPGECEVQADALSRGANKQTRKILIGAGENITGVDFSFSKGGVITGRVTDSDGRPVVRGYVRTNRVRQESDQSPPPESTLDGDCPLDDRGVYRIFGLAPGTYEVYYGPGFASSSQSLSQTYYPSTTDKEKASMVVVTAGEETTGVNIVPAKATRSKTFKASGRLINRETGQPMPDIEIMAFDEDRTGAPPAPRGPHGARSDARGNFTIERLEPGSYSLSARSHNGPAWFSDDVEFAITDGDVAGLEMQLYRGGSISGTVTIEGTSDPAVLGMLNQLTLDARVAPSGPNISTDGGFRVTGIDPGNVRVSVYGPGHKFSVVRVEKEGVDLGQSVTVASGEEVTGLRVIVLYCDGSIRGQVKVVGGSLQPGVLMRVIADPPGMRNDQLLFSMTLPGAVEPDLRGRFIISNLKPGDHQVALVVMGLDASDPESPYTRVVLSEPVTVSNGSESELTITLDLTPKRKSPSS
jgi:hypothetical protein